MVIGYFVLGVINLIMTIAIRVAVLNKKRQTSIKIWDGFKFPQKGDADDLLLSIYQIVSLLWILLGFFWIIVENKYSLNIVWLIFEFLCLIIPVLIGTLSFGFIMRQWKKGEIST